MRIAKTPKYIRAILLLFVFQIILTPQAVALSPIPGVPDKKIEDIINDAVSWILGIALAISIVMLIYGGLYYVSSSGDAEKATTSKKIIKYALLGVAITGTSYVIVKLLDTIIG